MKALLIDAFDSFVYVIYQYLGELSVDTEVIRANEVTDQQIRSLNPHFIVLGPGPGHPAATPYPDIINTHGKDIPILGVCLGHQAVGLAFGASVIHAAQIVHGKTSSITHDGKGCFRNIDQAFSATRYHSLAVADEALPEQLAVTARSEDGTIMGVRHRTMNIEGVQFHPESIATENGHDIIANFMSEHVVQRKAR